MVRSQRDQLAAQEAKAAETIKAHEAKFEEMREEISELNNQYNKRSPPGLLSRQTTLPGYLPSHVPPGHIEGRRYSFVVIESEDEEVTEDVDEVVTL